MSREDWKSDDRAPRGGWAPGDYIGTCRACKARYIGAKRSFECADCAYDRCRSEGTIPMTQKMTAAEALARAWESMDENVHDYRDGAEGIAKHLKLLGFTIIPIEPDDAAIERVAHAAASVDLPTGLKATSIAPRPYIPIARAAYAAITAPSSEK